jgi:hypothetical protein
MPFVLADRRAPALLVADASNGVRVATRNPRQARVFANAEAARIWATQHLLAVEFEALVLLNARQFKKKNPASAGGPSGINSTSSKESDHAIRDAILYRIDRP